MKPGEWSVSLDESTPYSVRALLDFFGHILVTPAHVDPRRFDDAAMLAMARFTGIMRSRSRRSIGGIGLGGWLGSPEGIGILFWLGIVPETKTFADWVTYIFNNVGLTATADPSITASIEANVVGMTRRQALDHIVGLYGAEYRVFADGTAKVGTPAYVGFVTTPEVVALRRSGGREVDLAGLQALELDMDQDVENYVNEVVLFAAGEGAATWAAAAWLTSPPYKNLQGDSLFQRLAKSVDSPAVQTAHAGTVADAELNAAAVTRQAVRLSTDTYDIGRDVQAGDYIYVFDPDAYLFDTANEVRYRGRIIYPVELRVHAVTWPIEAGMGVYYRDGDGAYTDLTDWVVFENGATTFEVGAPKRTLSAATANPDALIERLNR